MTDTVPATHQAAPAKVPAVRRGDQTIIQPLYPQQRLLSASAVQISAMARRLGERLARAEVEAAAIVQRARDEARQLKQTAAADAQAMLDQARAQAEAATAAHAAAVAASVRDQTVPLLTTLGDGLQRREDRRSERLTDMAFQIARAILHAELRLHPDQILPAVRLVLQRVQRSGNVTVRLHPDDAVVLQAHLGALAESLPAGSTPRLHGDESLRRGDILIDCADGQYDGSLRHWLQAVAEHLRLPGVEATDD